MKFDSIFKVRKSRKARPPLVKPKSRVYEEPKPKKLSKMVERARAITQQLDEVKPLYHELDEIVAALVAAKEGLSRYGVAIKDNFEVKNTQFKTVAMRRYDIEWIRR